MDIRIISAIINIFSPLIYSGTDESELSDLDKDFGHDITARYKHEPRENEDVTDGMKETMTVCQVNCHVHTEQKALCHFKKYINH